MVSKVLYYNQAQQFPQIQQDYRDIKQRVDKEDSINDPIMYALEALPPVRRISSLPDKIQNGDILPALGLAGLVAVNFPEDMRDINSAWKQLTEKGYKASYNMNDYQHRFSFFRGTLLKNFANPNKAKDPDLARKLLNADKTIFQTKFGQKILKALNVSIDDVTPTTIEDIISTKKDPVFVEAFKFKGNGKFKAFGELTGRAMTRTTLVGTAVLAALELPKIFKAMEQGDNIIEQAGNTAKQTVKSGINFASITTGIAYGGAIGSKYGKSAGSLIGMGAGAILGAFSSKKIQEFVS